MRRLLAWAFTVPLALAGSQSAHELAYRLEARDAHARATLLAETGHGYFGWLPLLFAVATIAGMLGLVAVVRDTGARSRPRWWMFAAFGPAVFFVQEHLERALSGSDAPWLAAGDRTFLLGLALQLPFALLAYVAARLLVRVALAILGSSPPRRRRRPASETWRPRSTLCSGSVLLAFGRGSRGPPSLTR